MAYTVKHRIGDWQIAFTGNVHMYCHDLSASDGKHNLRLPCEDLPSRDKTVGIWLYDLPVSAQLKAELQSVLLEWADVMGICCLVYTSRETHVTNSGDTRQTEATDGATPPVDP